MVAGDSYGKVIEEQLQEERAVKSSLEQRGLAVITTSGAIASLLLGLTAIAVAGGNVGTPAVALALAAAALLAFVIAAIAGIACNWPRDVLEGETDDLYRITLGGYWNANTALGSRRAARLRVKLLDGARARNEERAQALRVALIAEVFGIALLSIAVVVVLFAEPSESSGEPNRTAPSETPTADARG